jgi:hypothetical protein
VLWARMVHRRGHAGVHALIRIQASGLRRTPAFSAGRCCGGKAGSSGAVLYVFEIRSQRGLNGGGRPVLRAWARWVPDLS